MDGLSMSLLKKEINVFNVLMELKHVLHYQLYLVIKDSIYQQEYVHHVHQVVMSMLVNIVELMIMQDVNQENIQHQLEYVQLVVEQTLLILINVQLMEVLDVMHNILLSHHILLLLVELNIVLLDLLELELKLKYLLLKYQLVQIPII